MKACTVCGGPRNRPNGAQGLASICRSCHAKRTSERRHECPERTTLTLMIQRCHNPRHPKFRYWGGRGIIVAPEWRGIDGFDRFLEHIGPRPSPKHSVDRFPNKDGNYEPGNVRWATQSEQMRNTRITRMVVVDGVSAPLVDVAERTGINRDTLVQRLKRGISPEDAITAPVQPGPDGRPITVDGVTKNQADWSLSLGGGPTLVCERLARGWSEREAVTVPAGVTRGWRKRRCA